MLLEGMEEQCYNGSRIERTGKSGCRQRLTHALDRIRLEVLRRDHEAPLEVDIREGCICHVAR